MSRPEGRLLRHLVIAVALKLAVLAALWWAFVHDARVDVDAERAAAHIGMSAPSQGDPP